MAESTRVFDLTVVATGTGSVFFTLDCDPWVSVQHVNLTGTNTVEFSDIAYSNFSAPDVAGAPGGTFQALTGSEYSIYFATDAAAPSMVFTTSSIPSSQMVTLSGALGTRHTRFRFGSKTGGNFRVAAFGKRG